MLAGYSKAVSIKCADQCVHIINNRDTLNRLKPSTKIQNIESLFKYQSHIYNVQRNSDFNH